MNRKFYRCSHCGNVITFIEDKGAPVVCCGEKMTALEANSENAAVEKHVPEVTVTGDKIKAEVSEVMHPMTEQHFIEWIYLETENGGQLKYLSCDGEPTAEFAVTGDKPVRVYAYCNLHGLWSKDC